MQFVLFTDNLASLSLADACAEAKKAGFDGLDLTLRHGGHVLPENAEMGLAEAKRLADDHGLVIPMASTNITDTDDPHAEQVFASAAHYGVRKLKLGYWHYEPFGTAKKQLDDVRAKLERLTKLGDKYGVLPCVHCHSGRILANGGSTLYLILQDLDPKLVGAYVDPMHMTVEGGLAGWEIGLDLLAPWVALVGIKNFRWRETGREDGQPTFSPEYVPLEEGQAPLPRFMKYLKQIGYDGVVSLHSEYKGVTVQQTLEMSAKDLAYMKKITA